MRNTGAWEKDDIPNQHVFSLNLARWIGDFLPKDVPLIDMGCGLGDYLWVWDKMGFVKLIGIEGSDLEVLFRHDRNDIIVHDLTEPIKLGIEANVVALEVGEHIPSHFMQEFLNNICENTGDSCYLILSWAIPGQSGYGHVNCLSNETVIREIEKRGFEFLPRETISARDCIEHTASWFRNTILIFKKNA